MQFARFQLRSNPVRAAVLSGLAALAMIVAGCSSSSDSPVNPGQVNPGGTGSATLLVVGEVAGADVVGGAFDTNFRVTVADTADVAVSGAIVVIQGPFGSVVLTENPAVAGEYTGFRNGYSLGTYVLGVSAGADAVTGIFVTAPVAHTITSPTVTDILVQNQPFNVTWSRTATAQETQIETRDYTSAWTTGDTGLAVVPASGNPPRTNQRIRVRRRNIQSANGGRPGSEFRVEIRNSVEPVVSQ